LRVLLDTHTLLWTVNGDPRLSEAAHRIITSLRTEVFVSAASAWEIATKVRIGRLPGAELLSAEFEQRIERLGFHQLSITVEHGQRAGSLPGDHKDPFDRMLIAQAQAENLTLVSKERIFDDWHVPRIW
jgi:PIN domain nuclease of toxin-antitoxin system